MSRLERLLGTDEGFYLLALHAFMESYICENSPLNRYADFTELVWAYKDYLRARRPVEKEDVTALIRIQREHSTANKVRHGFLRLDPEEAVAATYNFLGFCRACGIGHPFLDTLRANLKIWDEKVSPMQKSAELGKLKFELSLAQGENRKLLDQAAEAREAAARSQRLEADLKAVEAELARERARADSKADRVDQLRGQLNDLGLQKRALEEELARFHDLELYVEHLNRFSVYTRTRRDYERSLMRLTTEQQAALDAIVPGYDFLIRGGAGTGKTVVLLHAFSKARKLLGSELGVDKPGCVILLTYTNTLVKYDRYLAELLKCAEGPGHVQTADSFLLSRLRAIDPGWRVDYDAAEDVARSLNSTGFLSDAELVAEVEGFLFGNMVSREEYVENRVPRRGMRQPLSGAQRAQVWQIRELMAAEMDRTNGFSKNYSRLKLIEHLQAQSSNGTRAGTPATGPDVDFIFVDESQDLTAADLKALKLLCSRGVIMAGDTAQAIYNLGSPYRRAGIDISGRTRILRTDFRTTCPIHDFAEKYRSLCGPDVEGETVTTSAFREGPVPELYRAGTREELLKLLVEKASLFLERLGYDPENVTILAPAKRDLLAIQERLSRRGIKSADIREEGFSFSEEGMVRLSTLHSSKGLDFPVVLLYLPGLSAAAKYDEKTAEGLARNLIYVAVSRAMDNLNVFVLEEPAAKPVQEMVEAFALLTGK